MRRRTLKIQGVAMLVRDRVRPETKTYAKDLRKRQTKPEQLLWSEIRGGKLGLRFRRQAVVLGWIPDFWCPAAKLVVEVDGGYHGTPEQRAKDARRDEVMRQRGIRVLRFTNERIDTAIQTVLREIRAAGGPT